MVRAAASYITEKNVAMFERTGVLTQAECHSRYEITLEGYAKHMHIDAATMLEMATIGGARALKLDDKIGSLEIGKLADIIAVDLSGSHQTPTTDPVSAVVNTCSGADILMTMVNGTALYEKNKWNVGVEVARIIEIRGKLRL